MRQTVILLSLLISSIYATDCSELRKRVRRQSSATTILPLTVVKMNETTKSFLFMVEHPYRLEQPNISFTNPQNPNISVLIVNSYTGFVYLKEGESFDYALRSSYQFNISIIDGATLLAIKPYEIRLIDVNDRSPTFERKRPFASVSEELLMNSLLYTFSATDSDSSAKLQYAMLAAGYADENRFAVSRNRKTGRVRMATNYFDRQELVRVSAIVQDVAAETNATQLDMATLSIFAGDAKPRFDVECTGAKSAGGNFDFIRSFHGRRLTHRCAYYFSFYELNQPRILVATVRATSHRASARGSPVAYRIAATNVELSGNFSFDSNTGQLFTQKSFVFEMERIRLFRFEVVAYDVASPLFWSSISLFVELLDVNNHDPFFQLRTYVAYNVSQSVARGSEVMRIACSDLDDGENARLRFTVLDADTNAESRYFTVDSPDYSTAVLKTRDELNYSMNAEHAALLTLVAYDQGRPARSASAAVRVHLTNTNKNPPQFVPPSSKPIVFYYTGEQYKLPMLIGQVQAIDPDGSRVSYFFDSGSPPYATRVGLFSIRPESGQLYLQGNPDPRPIAEHSWNLQIIAIDDGNCSACPPCSTLASVAGLPPCPRQHVSRTFAVKQQKLVNSQPTFVNCNKSAKIRVQENKAANTQVFRIVAQNDDDWNENKRITYTLIEKTRTAGQQAFKIEANSGVISLARSLDRENPEDSQQNYISVYASDSAAHPLSALCVLEVEVEDVNDNKPMFDALPRRYTNTIALNATVGTKVLRVLAYDPDLLPANRLVKYRLAPANRLNELFTIDASSGWIRTAVDLRRWFTDNQFSEFAAGRYDVVLQVEAFNDAPFQDALSSSSSSASASAWNTLQVSINIVNTSNAAVTLHRASFSANYDSMVVSKLENVTTGSIIANVSAFCSTAHDTPVGISLLSGMTPITNAQSNSVFQGHVMENALAISTRMPLDFEAVSSYLLQISAQPIADPFLQRDLAYLNVSLIDVNNKLPQFFGFDSSGVYTINLPENSPWPYDVLTVVAADADASAAFRNISYSLSNVLSANANQMFAIDSTSGRLFTKQMFDREQTSTIVVIVTANDGAASSYPEMNGAPNSATASVSINIVDVNDNSPVFDEAFRRNASNVTAREDVPIGVSVPLFRIYAIDRDDDALLTYSILSGNADGTFVIDPESGYLYAARKLDHESVTSYQLNCSVFDGLYLETVGVNIYVQATNDEAPSFAHSPVVIRNITETFANVLLPSSFRQPILTLTATDRDSPSSLLRYRLVDGPTADKFLVTNNVLYLTAALDRDYPNGYPVWSVLVEALDQATDRQMTGYVQVDIDLVDLDDNAPFLDPFVTAYVYEKQALSTVVLNVTNAVIDYDTGANAQASVSATSTSTSDYLVVNTDGLLLLNTAIDLQALPNPLRPTAVYESFNQTLSLVVTVRGKLTPTFVNSAPLYVEILDVNNQPPVFSNASYYFSVAEELPVGSFLFALRADDGDSCDDAMLKYAFESSSQYFTIHTVSFTNAAQVYVASRIDYDAPNNVAEIGPLKVQVRDSSCPAERFGSAIFGIGSEANCPTGWQSHVRTAQLTVRVVDVNDNAPVIDCPTTNQSVFDFAELTVALRATDADSGANGLVDLFLDRGHDASYYFSITNVQLMSSALSARPYTTAELRSVKPMSSLRLRLLGAHYANRHIDAANIILPVIAVDRGSPRLSSTCYVHVTVLSSAMQKSAGPQLVLPHFPVIIDENLMHTSSLGLLVATVQVTNALPPFNLTVQWAGTAPNGFSLIKHTQDSFTINTQLVFDREKQSTVPLTLLCIDNNRQLSSTGTLTLTIGDVDDNMPQFASKTMHVLVYNDNQENASLRAIVAGYVYAKNDDWDRGKTTRFELLDADPSKFQLNASNGDLYVYTDVEGSYSLRAKVTDSVGSSEASVQLTVETLTNEQVYNVAGLRIRKTTVEALVDKVDLLQVRIATILGIAATNVRIVNMYTVPDDTFGSAVHVVYTARNSPVWFASRVNGLFALNVDMLRETLLNVLLDLDVTVDAPLNLCDDVNSCDGLEQSACNTVLDYAGLLREPYNLVQVNSTSRSFVNARFVRQCTCQFAGSDGRCLPDTCHFKGSCLSYRANQSHVTECQCRTGDAARCQHTRHSFTDAGFAWYAALPGCDSVHISLSFATLVDSAMLLYSGPMTASGSTSTAQNFLSAFLYAGSVVLVIRFENGKQYRAIVNDYQQLKVNDGKWHRVDIHWTPNGMRLMLDTCKLPHDYCVMAVNFAPGERRRLNLQSFPLQLGGLFKASNQTLGGSTNRPITTQYPSSISYNYNLNQMGSLDGCIRDLKVNGRLYDLHLANRGFHANDQDGCSRELCACGQPFNSSRMTCSGDVVYDGAMATAMQYATAEQSQCVCKPGLRGQECTTASATGDFSDNAFVNWNVPATPSLAKRFTLQLRFRTRSVHAVLLALYPARSSQPSRWKQFILRITNCYLSLEFNFGNALNRLQLPGMNVSDGIWHNVRVVRGAGLVELLLDDGERANYAATFIDKAAEFTPNENVFAGGPGGEHAVPFEEEDRFVGCMQDIRLYSDEQSADVRSKSTVLPISIVEETQDYLIAKLVNVTQGCAEPDICLKERPCPPSYVCQNLWRSYICLCPAGWFESTEANVKRCVPSPCASSPCLNGGSCINIDKQSFTCSCLVGFSGVYCEILPTITAQVALSEGGLIALLVCAAIASIILLVAVISCRKARSAPTDPTDGVNQANINPAFEARETIADCQDGVWEMDNFNFDLSLIVREAEKIKPQQTVHELRTQPTPLNMSSNEVERAEFLTRGTLGSGKYIFNSNKNMDPLDLHVPQTSSASDAALSFRDEGDNFSEYTLSSLATGTTDASLHLDSQLFTFGHEFRSLAELFREAPTTEV